jgi:hypothetical protein
MGQQIERASSLLERLYGSGALSQGSANTLLETGTAVANIDRALGDASIASDLLLATLLVDDSPSIAPNIKEIHDGHSKMLEALAPDRAGTDVLVHTRALNYSIFSRYQALDKAARLTDDNFNRQTLRPGTPLYSQSVLALGAVLAKAQAEEDRGAQVRTFTLIISDGEDNQSGSISASNVRFLVTDMLGFSTNHIVAGMGVGGQTDFRRVFRSMGVPERWIFDVGTNADDLRAVFQKIARALRLAASPTGFLQLAAGPPSD